MLSLDDFVPVAFRIDKGPVRKGRWLESNNAAYTMDRSIFDLLIKEIPNSKRIVFKVQDRQVIVVFDDSIKKAIKDFQSRILGGKVSQ